MTARFPALVCAAGLSACLTGDDPIPAPTVPDGGLVLSFVAAESEDGEEPAVDVLRLAVTELVFQADGPDGASATSVTVGSVFDVSSSVRTAEVLLSPGTWRDVRLSVHLAPLDGEPGLFAAGEDDDRTWQISADTVVFSGETSRLVVPSDGRAQARLHLEPAEWAAALDEDGNGVVTPGSPDFDEVLERIEESEIAFDEAED